MPCVVHALPDPAAPTHVQTEDCQDSPNAHVVHPRLSVPVHIVHCASMPSLRLLLFLHLALWDAPYKYDEKLIDLLPVIIDGDLAFSQFREKRLVGHDKFRREQATVREPPIKYHFRGNRRGKTGVNI